MLHRTRLACAGTPAQCTFFNPQDARAIFLGQLPRSNSMTSRGNDFYLSLCAAKTDTPCAGNGQCTYPSLN